MIRARYGYGAVCAGILLLSSCSRSTLQLEVQRTMMVAIPKERFTLEEYIEFDKNSEERYEYFDGVVVSMSGGTLAHNRISANTLTGLRDKALAQGCEVLPADMRIRVPKAPPYRYADLVVVCGQPVIESVQGLDVLVNPLREIYSLVEFPNSND